MRIVVGQLVGPTPAQSMILPPDNARTGPNTGDGRPRIGFWRDLPASRDRSVSHMRDFAEMKRRGIASGGDDAPDGGVARYLREQAALPDAQAFVDPSWDPRERDAVAAYVDNGWELASYKGCSNCRICGLTNGSQDWGDEVYRWPEGFAHYIREHNVRPPPEFVAHALGASTAAASGLEDGVALPKPAWVQEESDRVREIITQITGQPAGPAKRLVEQAGLWWDPGPVRLQIFSTKRVNVRIRDDGSVEAAWADGDTPPESGAPTHREMQVAKQLVKDCLRGNPEVVGVGIGKDGDEIVIVVLGTLSAEDVGISDANGIRVVVQYAEHPRPQ